MIEIDYQHAELTRLINKLPISFAGHPKLMRAIAGDMAAAVEDNFAAQGRPAWLGIQPKRIASDAPGKKRLFVRKAGAFVRVAPRDGKHKILQLSGQLANSISPFSDRFRAIVGTNLPYAAIHHFGGTTKAHTIKPKYKKALAFGGNVVKSVNHPGSKIPARPFLTLTTADHAQILHTTSLYLSRLF